ncbi:ATP-binding protein [Streptomyces anandii]|uniref:ATP-binding protein n=1 Tax=Streptomyces anandii TaxID=285454 RepID=UPI00167802D0|nr:ATP-binding protein [Streptomyces anandii]GGX79114.1 hypothetical protein GCM10010510_25080 [Streptomyces anandii JCM 4720]
MVIPLRKQAADDRGSSERTPLGFGAAWTHGAARAVEARQALRAFLAHAPRTGRVPLPESVCSDAELIVSELISNAVRHAPGPCGLILRLSDDELAVTVWDTSAEEPVFMRPDRHRIGGHGLHLVRATSHSVSIAPRAPGKQITARLLLTTNDVAGTLQRDVLRAPLSHGENTPFAVSSPRRHAGEPTGALRDPVR